MIIDESVSIKVKGNNKIKFYKNLGYDISGDYLAILSKDILPTSTVIVNAKCDFCENIVSIKYKNYYKNFKRSNKFSCSKACSMIKTKNTNVERYGVENPALSDKIKDKIKQTNIERYGNEITFKSQIIKDKIKQTNLERYGVENPALSDEIKDKIKQTNLERYGNIHFFKSDRFISNLDEYKKKIKSKYFRFLGAEHPMKSELFRYKFNICNDNDYIKYKDKGISVFKCDKGHEFEINSDNYRSRKINKISLCTICNPIGESPSIKEKDLLDFIKSIYNRSIINSYRDGLEIDIYLPDLKLGFEFNGLYWHSEAFKGKKYHIEKTNYFQKKCIRIIHIWEDDWSIKNEIIKSQIKNIIGKTEHKIFARNCEIKVLNNKESSDFLDKNHIQGKDRSIIRIGLLYRDEIVSIMTFDKFNGRNKMSGNEWNLSRFCNKLDTIVIGGASKIFKHFIKLYNPIRIISYSDKNWSQGNLYLKLGFKKLYESRPDYKYIIGGKRIHKSNFKKSKTKQNISESEYMNLLGINRIYDCGKIKFEVKI